MGRQLRLDPEHGIHHVYSRGTRRWTLFIDDLDYQRFIQRLGVVCVRYRVSINAYCLMGNHFHLVAYCPEAQLSAALRDLKSVYARTHNERHGFSGPLFESRFNSKLVTSYEYLRTLVRYVHRNALAIDAAAPLATYQYSSHGLFLADALARPDWLDPSLPLSLFANKREYRDFVEMGAENEQPPRTAPPDHGVKQGFQPLNDRPSLATILLTLSQVAGCELSAIRARQRNGLIGIAMLIASDVTGHTSAELADACGFSSPNAVTNAKRAVRRRMETDHDLAAIHDDVVKRITAL